MKLIALIGLHALLHRPIAYGIIAELKVSPKVSYVKTLSDIDIHRGP